MTERMNVVLRKKDKIGEVEVSLEIEIDFPHTLTDVAFNFVRENLAVWEKKDE